MKARYIRVSTTGQKTERQEKFKDGETPYIDKISGLTPFDQRPAAKQLLQDIADGKINYVSVETIDRLGRDAFNVQSTLHALEQLGVTVYVDNLNQASIIDGKPNLIFKIICDVLANIADNERKSMLEKQKGGIQIAKDNGVYKGRDKGTTESKAEFLAKYKDAVKYTKQNKFSFDQIAKMCDISKNTAVKIKKLLTE